MTVEDDVLRALRARADGMTDAELAAELGKGHQHINGTCRTLENKGRVVRHHYLERGIVNKVSNDAPSSPVKSPQRSLLPTADDVLRALRARADGMTDAELSALLGKRHQHINQTCRRLADQGRIVRGHDSERGIVNKVSNDAPSSPVKSPRRSPLRAADEKWEREERVQSRVVTHLATNGWSIIQVANTARRERGVDIIAERDGQELLVEVKGWPSTTYARGERAGQPKPTEPSTQAGHWFAEALLTLVRRDAEPGTRLAMGLPDKLRYRKLLNEAGGALERLDITVYLVTAEGAVQTWEREN